MSSDTEIFFPDTLPFPFTVRSLIRPKGSGVEQGNKLLNYSFVSRSSGPESRPETRFGSWDATFEGELKSWNVQPGDVVTRERAKSRPALRITESCKHGVQFNGLCALCGMDMTSFDYTARAESSKANIQMTHSASGPTVSLEEAQRLERETAEHLLKSRRLTLIVDLDQTIVHATVDPTVGDWITEGEEWEAKHTRNEERRARAAAKKSEDNSEDSDDSDDSEDEEEEEEEVNPNWEALKDVKKFRLAPDNFGAPRSRWPNQRSNRGIQDEGCLYYIKPRPGWTDFLSSIATKYEMHVYTMGTRAYAEKVCAAIDPDGNIFGNRILSRDESGSLTQKSLRRLFPCDQSMVVIIDDRADVWEWSPNLIKVIPYDFFVGIGDINSAFLPKVDAMGTANLAPTEPEESKPTISSEDGNDSSTPILIPSSVIPQTSSSDASSADSTDPSEEERASSEKSEMITKNALALEAQVEERPLAKKQEQLESDDEEDDQSEQSASGANVEGAPNGTPSDQGDHTKKHHRKALLKNDDFELLRINELLDEVHKRFFTAYDNRIPESSTSKRRRSVAQREVPYDVKFIIPNLRKETFKDVHILFSGVIPTNMRVSHENTEIWKMARAFGATCHKDLVKEVTHVVTSKRGTQKVEKARQLPGVFVVWIQWFSDSIAQWHRLDESRYLLEEEEQFHPDLVASSPPSDPNAVSSDTDPEALVGDGDDDDMEDALDAVRIPNGSRSTSVSLSDGDGDGDAGERREQGTELPGGELNLNDVDWQDVNDEVDAAMAESDSDEDEDETESVKRGGSAQSSVVSEDECMDEDSIDIGGLPQTPRRQRKRLRSVTPSESGSVIAELLKSPLSKRKKIAAERSGMSKLKLAMSATEIGNDAASHETGEESNPGSPVQENGSQGSFEEEDDDDDDSGEDEGDDDIDDDFLAREMEEELG